MPLSASLRAEAPPTGTPNGHLEPGVYPAEATLDALQGLMRAHRNLPGRKILVLFTTDAFRGVAGQEAEMNAALAPVRALAQQGFSIWTVDATGIGSGQEPSHSYLSALARETAGGSIRRTGDLAEAFRNAEEQSSCYYLFSLPVAAQARQAVTRTVDIRIDPARRPELWSHRVVARPRVTLTPESAALQDERLAAMISPDDFSRPPVEAALGFPVRKDGADVMPVRFRAPLGALTWVPHPAGGFVAKLLLDAVVHRDARGTLREECAAPAEKGGSLTLKLPAIPRDDPRTALAVEWSCPVRKDGLHTARAVITDVDAGTAGSGRSTVLFRRGAAPGWHASALRVEASSGRDFVWLLGQPGSPKRDADRRAGRRIHGTSAADPGDRLHLQYVLCGPDLASAARGVRHAIAFAAGGATVLTFGADALHLADGESAPDGGFCRQARLELPEYTLEPGQYVFEVRAAESARVLASTAFEVATGGKAAAAR